MFCATDCPHASTCDDTQVCLATKGDTNSIPTVGNNPQETPVTTDNPFANTQTEEVAVSNLYDTKEPVMTAEMTTTDKIDALMTAVTEGRKVRFTYTNYEGKTRTHIAIPSHVFVYADGRVRFKGINHGKGLTYDVSKMTDISLFEPMKNQKKWYYPASWDLATYCRSALKGKNVADYLARGWSETPVVITQAVA